MTFYPYAITLTLNPKMYSKKPLTQYKYSCLRLNEIIKDESLDFVELVPELTNSNNIHYHGTILLQHQKWAYANDYIHELFRKEQIFGFLCIKDLTDSDKWSEYISKQKDIIDKLLYSKTFIRPLTKTRLVEERLRNDLIENQMSKLLNGDDLDAEPGFVPE